MLGAGVCEAGAAVRLEAPQPLSRHRLCDPLLGRGTAQIWLQGATAASHSIFFQTVHAARATCRLGAASLHPHPCQCDNIRLEPPHLGLPGAAAARLAQPWQRCSACLDTQSRFGSSPVLAVHFGVPVAPHHAPYCFETPLELPSARPCPSAMPPAWRPTNAAAHLAPPPQFDVIMMDPPWQLATANPTRGVALGYSQV